MENLETSYADRVVVSLCKIRALADSIVALDMDSELSSAKSLLDHTVQNIALCIIEEADRAEHSNSNSSDSEAADD